MLSQDELNKIRERAEKATKGTADRPVERMAGTCRVHLGLEDLIADAHSEADADFIAAAYRDIPALLEHVAEVERQLNEASEIAHAAASDWEFMKSGGELLNETVNSHIRQLRTITARQALARKEGV